MRNRIWYDTWTERYIEGLPVGNGRLAAMLLGKPERLRIALNHEWLWRGENRFRSYPDVSEKLPQVRRLLLDGNFLEGTTLANRCFGGSGGISGEPPRNDPFEPAGDVWVLLEESGISDYRRSLDLDSGVAEITFRTNNGAVIQRCFASSTDGCIAADVRSEHPVTMQIVLNRTADARCSLCYEGSNPLRMKGKFQDGLSFAVALSVQTDGVCSVRSDTVTVQNAAHLFLMLQIGTDAKGSSPAEELQFPENFDFDALLARHLPCFQQRKGDSVLDVDIPDCDLPTDRRIGLFRQGRDPALALLFFEYGRYLMVSGSSGELPLNLQGKWNEELQPPWESDYHLDINLQMCYWFTETLGMQHASEPLFALIERFIPYGKVMAKHLYGCRGVTFCLQTDVWGRVTPEACGWAVWVGAAPWLARHMFQHWRYTRDLAFLENRCYPFLKEVAIFFTDYLTENNGKLYIVPSQSPENRFEGTGDWPVSLGYNSAMDIELVTELLKSAIESSEILNVDQQLRDNWKYAAANLPPLTTDSFGRLNEWDRERPEVEPGHRHFSHLYGLYPSELFEPDSWEWKAAEKSADFRLHSGGGHTGWSRAWASCLMARLGRAEDAWSHFQTLIGEFATVSLLDLHPPGIFQIDGNMGASACICEMLMQSRRGLLRLLPALPPAWKTGHAAHFHAQDDTSVSFSWKDSILTQFTLISGFEQEITVVSGAFRRTLFLKSDIPQTVFVDGS